MSLVGALVYGFVLRSLVPLGSDRPGRGEGRERAPRPGAGQAGGDRLTPARVASPEPRLT